LELGTRLWPDQPMLNPLSFSLLNFCCPAPIFYVYKPLFPPLSKRPVIIRFPWPLGHCFNSNKRILLNIVIPLGRILGRIPSLSHSIVVNNPFPVPFWGLLFCVGSFVPCRFGNFLHKD
jgi:hypothetical protein